MKHILRERDLNMKANKRIQTIGQCKAFFDFLSTIVDKKSIDPSFLPTILFEMTNACFDRDSFSNTKTLGFDKPSKAISRFIGNNIFKEYAIIDKNFQISNILVEGNGIVTLNLDYFETMFKTFPISSLRVIALDKMQSFLNNRTNETILKQIQSFYSLDVDRNKMSIDTFLKICGISIFLARVGSFKISSIKHWIDQQLIFIDSDQSVIKRNTKEVYVSILETETKDLKMKLFQDIFKGFSGEFKFDCDISKSLKNFLSFESIFILYLANLNMYQIQVRFQDVLNQITKDPSVLTLISNMQNKVGKNIPLSPIDMGRLIAYIMAIQILCVQEYCKNKAFLDSKFDETSINSFFQAIYSSYGTSLQAFEQIPIKEFINKYIKFFDLRIWGLSSAPEDANIRYMKPSIKNKTTGVISSEIDSRACSLEDLKNNFDAFLKYYFEQNKKLSFLQMLEKIIDSSSIVKDSDFYAIESDDFLKSQSINIINTDKNLFSDFEILLRVLVATIREFVLLSFLKQEIKIDSKTGAIIIVKNDIRTNELAKNNNKTIYFSAACIGLVFVGYLALSD